MHCEAAKLAFSDRPWTPRGPKKGQNGPFGATHVKNGIDGCDGTEISLVPPIGVFRILAKTAPQRSFSQWPKSGRFGRFSGPRGPKWKNLLLTLTQKERCCARARCTQVTLFPYNCWVSAAKTRFGPVSGVP